MRRLSLVFLMMVFACVSFAVPAKRGVVKTLRLADGTEVRARLAGDETMHYYVTEEGKRYVEGQDGLYHEADMASLEARAARRRSQMNAAIGRRAMKRVGGTGKLFTGKKKGLIILVEFSDKKFKAGHDRTFFQRMANEPGFTTDDGFVGPECRTVRARF